MSQENEIREHYSEYEKYRTEQAKDDLEWVDYDTWVKIYLMSRKEGIIEQRPKPTVNEQMAEMALKSRLIGLKNSYYDELAGAIWNRKKQFNNWYEQGHMIDTLFNDLRKKIGMEIAAHIELVKGNKP